MNYNKDNVVARIGLSLEAYSQWRDTKANGGFRTIAISLAGPANQPLYSAVMVKGPQPFRAKSWARLDPGQVPDTIANMAGQEGLHPYVIGATGSATNKIYAIGFRHLGAKPVVKLNLTINEYQSENEMQRAAGRILIAVDSFGTADDIRFCAIWGANPDQITWNAESIHDTGLQRQQRFDALVSTGARESLLAMTPNLGVTRLFVDCRLQQSWSARFNLSKTEMEEHILKEASSKRFPTCIGTTSINGSLRCSGIFAGGDDIVPRVFRIAGPEPSGLSPSDKTKTTQIDAWMEDYVRAHNLRGAAIAIVEGTRLVYTKGYTFAEPSPLYNDIQPTTLFRIASVSKAFCAIAAWKALIDAPSISRNDTMQSVLGLAQLNGLPPADSNFGAVKISHLLTSNSGIDQDSVREIIREVKTLPNVSQPLTSQQVAARIAARSMAGQPGATKANKQATQYGRTDYFLLGLVAAKLTGVMSFETALQTLVLTPLKMTRTKGSRSRIEDQGTNEARHHLPALETGVSAVHNDRRLVPLAYGAENYEVYDGAGGLSSAVVDLARLCAMLSCRTNNPLFTDEQLKLLLTEAVSATSAGNDHGYYGFDRAVGTYPAVTCNKAGGNPGVGAGFSGTTGGRFIILTRNGAKLEGASPVKWDTDLDAIAATINWKQTDLFPQFGMPALGK